MPEEAFFLAQGNTGPLMEFFIEKITGEPENLTGALVKAHMRVKPSGSVKFSAQTVTVVDGETGECAYGFTAAQSADADEFEFEAEVTYADGRVQTYPNDGYFPVKIKEKIA